MQGFIAIISVLIIAAVLVLLAVSAGQLTIGKQQMALQRMRALKSSAIAIACAEEALLKLKEDSNYAGSETFALDDGTCQVLPIEDNWTLRIIGSFANSFKKMEIAISQVNPEMIVDTWLEVSDF